MVGVIQDHFLMMGVNVISCIQLVQKKLELELHLNCSQLKYLNLPLQ